MTIKIDPVLKQGIVMLWGGLAPDAEEFCENDNEIAMELCLDARRLEMNGYMEAQRQLDALLEQYDWGDIRYSLSKQIQLL